MSFNYLNLYFLVLVKEMKKGLFVINVWGVAMVAWQWMDFSREKIYLQLHRIQIPIFPFVVKCSMSNRSKTGQTEPNRTINIWFG